MMQVMDAAYFAEIAARPDAGERLAEAFLRIAEERDEARATVSALVAVPDDRVVIWSGEHHAYWRPNSAGYTIDGLGAGLYARAEAESIVRGVGPEKRLELRPIPYDRPFLAMLAGRAPFQQRVAPWIQACFGPTIAADFEERNHRFLEEALELVQACGCTAGEAYQLVDYVFGRPVGEKGQEVGGVMVTLAALCLAQGLDLDAEAERELARIWTKVDAIRAKQAAKPKHSPLPQEAAPLAQNGYVDAFYAIAGMLAADALRSALPCLERMLEGDLNGGCQIADGKPVRATLDPAFVVDVEACEAAIAAIRSCIGSAS